MILRSSRVIRRLPCGTNWQVVSVLGFSSLLVLSLCAGSTFAQTVSASQGNERAHYERGKRLLEEGRYKEAAMAFQKAAAALDQPQPAAASLADEEGPRPLAFGQEEDLAQPSLPVETEAERRRRLSREHTEQAELSFSRARYAQALTDAQRAVELDSRNRKAKQVTAKAKKALHVEERLQAKKLRLIDQARAAERKGKDKRALALWRRAKAMDPDDPGIEEAMDQVHARLDAMNPRFKRASELTASLGETPLIKEYHVSIGDVLEVFVWQQRDISRNVIVRPDGRMSFPLVGDIDAVGLTLTKLDEILTEGLKPYLRYPDVSLAIVRFGGTKTIVLGEVGRPGIYVPTGAGRVLDAVAMAGGFKKDAVQQSVILVRGGLAAPQIAKLDLQQALMRGALQENVLLQPDDIVFVPKKRIASILNFMDQFYPTISEALVSQQLATNFGVRETSAGITR